MSNLAHKLHNQQQRQRRVRSRVQGTAARPRLSVHVSNLHISAQLVDDVAGKTVAAVSTVGQKDPKGTMTDRAAWVGTEIAGKARAAKVKSVVFDRGRKRHPAARE